MLNEITFNNYHLFRADAQILSASNSADGSIPNAPADASSKSLKSPSTTVAPRANDTSGSAASAEPPAAPAPSTATAVAIGESPSPVEAKSTISELATSQPAAPSTMSSLPEISVATPATFPQAPVPPAEASNKSSFSLSVNVRLVDVDVTAIDQKDQPVAGLSMKDF